MKKIDYVKAVDSLNEMVSSVSEAQYDNRHLQESVNDVFKLSLNLAFESFRDICKILKKEWNMTVLEINAVFLKSFMPWEVSETIRNKLPKEWFMEDGKVKQTYSKFFTDYYEVLSNIFTSELS